MFLVVQLSRSAGIDGVYSRRNYRSTVLCDKTAEVSIIKVAEHDRIIRMKDVEGGEFL